MSYNIYKIFASWQLDARLSANYQDKQYLTPLNEAYVPERTLVDANIQVSSPSQNWELALWIKNLADQSNLDLKSFVPGGMQPGEFYKKFPIEMEVLGRYHDMGIFMDRVSKYSRIINVDNLRMNSTTAGSVKSIRAGFTATTFVYDEQAEMQPQEVAQ